MFGIHPIFAIALLVLLVILVGAAYAVGWGIRKGWEAGRPAPRDTSPPA